MFMKIIAAAAVMVAPAVAHAQGTTKLPQDTTHSMTHIRTDSVKTDTANGSVVTKRKTTVSDTARATRTHTDSAMNVSPIDSTRMGVPATRSKTPPR
ncbi:MAG: hypothetical protein ABIQ10_08595 [Gemmatimonadaceae bacterium]